MVPDYEDMAVDALRDAGPSSFSPAECIARAQVFATLALVQAVQDLVIPLDGITEQLAGIRNHTEEGD
jgi:hypothetical protein